MLDRIGNELDEKFTQISSFPESYQKYGIKRYVMVDQFILIYEYNELTDEAAITNIIHQSMVKKK